VGRSQKSLKAYLVSLGCAKNLVDSERLLGLVEGLGFDPTGDPKAADLLLVNTCAFIESAILESVETILELAESRKPGAKLAVVGCLPARDRQALVEDLKEIDLLADRAEYGDLPRLIAGLFPTKKTRESLTTPDPAPFETWTRRATTPLGRAYLKVAEGCDRRCSFCIIPKLRGPLVTRPIGELVAEARSLVASGVLELTLVAQDLTAYRDQGQDLGDLVTALAAVTGLKWLRLMYAHPLGLSTKLIKKLAQSPLVVPYLDLPFQHASVDVLKRMARPAKDPLELVKRLRSWWPNVALRTTLMVGFPGETEADFKILEDFIEAAKFDHVGVFEFTPEEPALAATMPNQVPKSLAKKRRAKLMRLQKKISLAHNLARVGQEYEVLVEGPAPDSPLFSEDKGALASGLPEDGPVVMVGRAYFLAPEVDGLIYFDGPQPKAGQMVKAKIIKAKTYDLAAKWLLES
jgi:ribosomal protein S12 methylthiotransferase RimO